MSPVRWTRRRSSSSEESERNCYNVQTSSVTTERISTSSSSAQKKDKKKIRDERRRACDKKNPLLDRVRNTRLSFLKDSHNDLDEDEKPFRSMCELRRSEYRRSICENDLKQIIPEDKDDEDEEEANKRKRRSKSQSRLPCMEDKFNLFGFKVNESPKPRRRRWRKSKDVLCAQKSDNEAETGDNKAGEEKSEVKTNNNAGFDSVTPSSCLAAKFRAMQNRYAVLQAINLLKKNSFSKRDLVDRYQ